MSENKTQNQNTQELRENAQQLKEATVGLLRSGFRALKSEVNRMTDPETLGRIRADIKLRPILADVAEQRRINEIIEQRPDVAERLKQLQALEAQERDIQARKRALLSGGLR